MPLWEIPLWEQSLLAMQTPRFSVRLRHLHREQALLVQVLAKHPAFPTTAFLTLQNKATMTLPLLHLSDELTRLTLAPHLGASHVEWTFRSTGAPLLRPPAPMRKASCRERVCQSV